MVHVGGKGTGRASKIFWPFPGCPHCPSRRHSCGGADPEADPGPAACGLCGLGPFSAPFPPQSRGLPRLPDGLVVRLPGASALCYSEHLAGGGRRSPEESALPGLSETGRLLDFPEPHREKAGVQMRKLEFC